TRPGRSRRGSLSQDQGSKREATELEADPDPLRRRSGRAAPGRGSDPAKSGSHRGLAEGHGPGIEAKQDVPHPHPGRIRREEGVRLPGFYHPSIPRGGTPQRQKRGGPETRLQDPHQTESEKGEGPLRAAEKDSS